MFSSKAFSDAMISLMLDFPFYAHVLSELQVAESKDVYVAGVQLGIPPKLTINTSEFEKYHIKHRIGILKHEVLHLVMEHLVRMGDRNPTLWNVCADLAVNELIRDDMLPPDALTVDALRRFGLYLPPRAAAEIYYELLEQSHIDFVAVPGPDGGDCGIIRVSANGSSGTSGTFRIYDKHVHGSGDDFSGELTGELVRQIIERAAKTCGRMPAGLEEYINALQTKKLDWRRILFRYLAGRGRMLYAPSYTRESKRFDDYPGRRKKIGAKALVAIDTSGSMTNETLGQVLSHLLQIKKVSGTQIWVVWGDTRREGGPLPIEKVRNCINIKGRGGTDLCWPFEIADRMRIDTVVYFTDGFGPAPNQVRQRVLWALTAIGERPAGYGEAIRIEDENGRGRS